MADTQQQIYEYIVDTVNKYGYPPTVREICIYTGLQSTATVHGHLQRLERKGLIKRDPTKPRAITIIKKADKEISVGNIDYSKSINYQKGYHEGFVKGQMEALKLIEKQCQVSVNPNPIILFGQLLHQAKEE